MSNYKYQIKNECQNPKVQVQIIFRYLPHLEGKPCRKPMLYLFYNIAYPDGQCFPTGVGGFFI